MFILFVSYKRKCNDVYCYFYCSYIFHTYDFMIMLGFPNEYLLILFVTSEQEESSNLIQHIVDFFQTLSEGPCENDG